jgi:chemotaxis protein histidine kinase CheA/CheY-like chemotaxis protein
MPNEVVSEESIPAFDLEAEEVVSEESIPTFALEMPNEVVAEDIVQCQKTVLINGVEIDGSLYSLFNEESEYHLNELRAFIDKNILSNNVIMPYDFMRHAHTLASIAETINLMHFAKLVGKLEFVSNIALEKELLLNKEHMQILAYVIDNIEVFKDINLIDIDMELYENIIKSLDELQGLLNENVKFDIGISKEEIRNVIEKELRMNHINDSEEIVSKVMSQVQVLFDEKYGSLINEFKKQDELKNQNTIELLNKVNDLSASIETIQSNQAVIEKTQKTGIDTVRKELRILAQMVKKKSNGSYQDIFEDQLIDISDYDVENFEDSLTEEKLLDENNKLNISEDDLLIADNSVKKVEDLIVEPNSDLFANNSYIQSIFEDKISIVKDEIDPEIYEISKIEIEDIFSKMDEILESVEIDVINVEDTNTLKRYLHTFKGSVRMAGANRMGAVSHRLESLLDYSENHNISLFKIKPLIQKELEKLHFLEENGDNSLTLQKEIWLDTVSQKASPEISNDKHSVEPAKVEETKLLIVSPKKEDKHYIRVVSNTVDSLINEAGEIRLSRTTLEGVLDSNKKSLSDLKASSNKITKILKEIEVQAESQITARKDELFETGKDFDPLEFDQYTRLQELTRFMNEALLDVKDTVVMMDSLYRVQENAIVKQAIITNGMLTSLMNVRLISVDSISDRLYKITRNTAKELGKYVNLEIFGEKTEIDRLVLDKIQSPLEHLLRNSIAHGIEMPNIRILNNKPQNGKIVIDISQSGNFIIITISDDGAGINIERIKEIGYEKGLIVHGTDYSKNELIELIFKSGFSTVDVISQVAGRGVGMDVVKNEILALGGSIKTESENGLGTTFTIVLPVAVATTQAMLIESNGKLVAIPAIFVEQIMSLKKEQLDIAYKDNKVLYKGIDYPIYYLGHLLGMLPKEQKPEIKTYNTLILVSYLDRNIVIHVDKLETTNEILIKQMGAYFGKISGIMGATLLGDGRQGVVVNPILLMDHFNENVDNKESLVDTVITKKKEVLTVMVVDDSITVRRATFKILEKYGYNVILAKDGEDGLEQLQIMVPDIILSDIEMPVMDGFEFVKNIKNIERYKNIPIVMITSRTADKHRNLAYSLGVNGFLGKPYQEDELIKQIKDLTFNK